MSRAQLKTSRALWRRRELFRQKKRDRYRDKAGKHPTKKLNDLVVKWERLYNEAHIRRVRRDRQLKDRVPLRLKALHEARRMVGIMEVGGNNMGKQVLEIIKANGGTGPEPWCGDFVAWCYRRAGSRVVQRGWAAVRLLGRLTGMHFISSPKPGDIVCYNFDHTGIFVKWVGGGFFEAIEGNTGRLGAVSDSRTGGDGVYLKRRSSSLVARWVRVTR